MAWRGCSCTKRILVSQILFSRKKGGCQQLIRRREGPAVTFAAIAFAASVKCTNDCRCCKKLFKDDIDGGKSRAGEVLCVDKGTVFDLMVPFLAEIPKQNPLNWIKLVWLDWQESQCDKPNRLSYMLQKRFHLHR